MHPALLLLPVLAALTAPAQALDLRLCTDARSHPPLMRVDGQGPLDRLLQEAAQAAGVRLRPYPAPLPRCREELRAGIADAFPLASHTPDAAAIVAYPSKQGQPDVQRSLVQMRVVAVRRVGSAAQWDGQRFSNLQGPVLGLAGAVAVGRFAADHKLALDSSAISIDQNLEKLMAGRGELLLVAEGHLGNTLKREPYRSQLEVLDKPLSVQPMYLVVTHAFYEAHGAATEKLWTAAARLARSAPYKAELAEAMHAWSPE